MENLFDQFDIYIDTFCKSLQKEVEGIVQKSPNKKVYICAISRKTPKLLDLLHDKLASIWDKVVVFTEIITPGVTIVPMCCVRASEANLTFDNELKTTLVSCNKGHYFVNCLSRRFRKQCLPFEVEFPVFRIEITEKESQKAQRLAEKRHSFGRVCARSLWGGLWQKVHRVCSFARRCLPVTSKAPIAGA